MLAATSAERDVFNNLAGVLFAFVAWVASKAPEIARTAWAAAKVGSRHLRRRLFPPRPCVVTKVLAVNEDTGDHAVVTRAFRAGDWERSVREATGWTSPRVRVEVRYVAYGNKYRAVLRPGDECPVGSRPPPRHRGPPRGILTAHLLDGATALDVTRRVRKYEGPGKDFHGTRVRVTDMFPKDDPEEVATAWNLLSIRNSLFRETRVPADCPDLAAAMNETGKTDAMKATEADKADKADKAD